MNNLFISNNESEDHLKEIEPLASTLRPFKLDDFVGQKHLVGPNGIIQRMIDTSSLYSIILWGPPGCGKTTLIKLIASATGTKIVEFSAVMSGVKEVREIVRIAKHNLESGRGRTILFVDELHRFNKAQQDAFLPHVESGVIVLMGATTENPHFSINAPLLSRMKVYRLEPLNDDEMLIILNRAKSKLQEKLGTEILFDESAIRFLIDTSGGDGRFIINSVEVAVSGKEPEGDKIKISLDDAQMALMTRSLKYDKSGDEHYDIISAFIKSMRGSDPDATVYYLARMLEAGEDPKFIARRIVIQASEDVGNANPMALVVANAAREAVEFVGMPEASIPLAQAAIYVAVSPKSNASYLAISKAREDVQKGVNPPIPLHLRNAPFRGAKDTYGFSKGYIYPHDCPLGYVNENYLPKEIAHRIYYKPRSWGDEKSIIEWMNAVKKATKEFEQKKEGTKPEDFD